MMCEENLIPKIEKETSYDFSYNLSLPRGRWGFMRVKATTQVSTHAA